MIESERINVRQMSLGDWLFVSNCVGVRVLVYCKNEVNKSSVPALYLAVQTQLPCCLVSVPLCYCVSVSASSATVATRKTKYADGGSQAKPRNTRHFEGQG